MATILSAPELQRWIDEQRRFALIDVLPERIFNAQRLPGSRRATVYEVTFLDQIKALGVRPEEPVVLYGAGEDSLDSAIAAEKLERAGFQQVYDFRGGRTEWAQVGGIFEGSGALPVAPAVPAEKQYVVNPSKSIVEWVGRNLNTIHRGTIHIQRGHITVARGALAEGEVVLDMHSIKNSSVDDPNLRPVLDAHLRSDDFFDVERYPTAALKMFAARPLTDATPGMPNFEFSADLTVKDVTRSISFPAIVSLGEDGTLTSVAQIDIDRTQWNVVYGSGRLFKMLGMHLVNDIITLFVRIVAE